jgi:hypothetical protein
MVANARKNDDHWFSRVYTTKLGNPACFWADTQVCPY